MQKKDRQNTLISLIGSFSIANQHDLALGLLDKGFRVTQASVSRDLDELGIVKLNGRYSLPPKETGVSEFGAVSFDTAGPNLIVGRCLSGLASAITVRIDAANIKSIVGTIAGDDTVFIAVKDAKAQLSVLNEVNELFVTKGK